MKKLLLNPILRVLMLTVFTPGIVNAQYQKTQLYVSGNVSSNANMLVTVDGTKIIGGVVSAEMDGKKTEMRTNEKGQAILNFSVIAAGIAVPTVAIIKSFNKDGKLLSTANTTVQPGISQTSTGPIMDNLPANMANKEAVTIKGRNLGAATTLFVANRAQQVRTASDLEITAVPNSPTGQQPVYLSTPAGATPVQTTNFYTVDFDLGKNSISPTEKVQAIMTYDGIPLGTVMTFTNMSPQTINMNIPGATTKANQCFYTVADQTGRMPVRITGIANGDFAIGLDYKFSNEPVNNFSAPRGIFDISNNQIQWRNPCDSIKSIIDMIDSTLKAWRKKLKDLEDKKAQFDEGAKGRGPKHLKAQAANKKAEAKNLKAGEKKDKLNKEAEELEAKAKEMEENGVTDDRADNQKKSDEIAKDIKALQDEIKRLEDALKKKNKEFIDCLTK